MDGRIYHKLSDKAKKEVDAVLNTIMIEEYIRINQGGMVSLDGLYNPSGIKSNRTKTVEKRIRPYYLGYTPLENQDLLKALYEAELRIMELERLEESVNNIKQFITKGEK